MYFKAFLLLSRVEEVTRSAAFVPSFDRLFVSRTTRTSVIGFDRIIGIDNPGKGHCLILGAIGLFSRRSAVRVDYDLDQRDYRVLGVCLAF